MMTITLTTELEEAAATQAQARGLTPEEVVLEALSEKFLPASQSVGEGDALSEWEQMMGEAAAQIAAVSDGEHAGLAALEREHR